MILLLVLAGAEAALRIPQVRRLLPARTHYYHPIISRRIDSIERLLALHRRVDVLFAGSSIVVTNVHALLFDQIVGGTPGQVVSFNVGLPGLWPASVQLYLEHVWLPLTRPRVVVQGVRYPELAVTTHAKNATQVWTGHVEPAWRDAPLLTRIYSAAVSRLYLLQYRGVLVQWLERFRDGTPGTQDMFDDDRYAVRGYMPAGAPETGTAETAPPDLPNDGTCAGGRCAVGFAALRESIAAARAFDATYVLVNVPEHPVRWRGPGGLERYQRYIADLRAFAEAEGVAFIDPTDGDPFRFASTPYADLSHMTAAGSRQFTSALAARIMPLVQAQLKPPTRAAGIVPTKAAGPVANP